MWEDDYLWKRLHELYEAELVRKKKVMPFVSCPGSSAAILRVTQQKPDLVHLFNMGFTREYPFPSGWRREE